MNGRVNIWFGMIVSCLILVVNGHLAFAETFHVSDGDELQSALVEAAANGENDIIYLAEGLYQQRHGNPPEFFAGFRYYTGSSARESLTLRNEPGARPDQVILDGNHFGRVLEIYDGYRVDPLAFAFEALPSIHIIGLTLQNGGGTGLEISARSHHLTVKDCRILGNTSRSGGRGGGALIHSMHGLLIFENNLVVGNRLYEFEEPTDEGTQIVCQGGGVYIDHGGRRVVVRNNIFAYNSCEGENGFGGGLYLRGYADGPNGITWNLSNNTIIHNSGLHGGGLFAFLRGILNLFNNIIHANTSSLPGTDAVDLMVDDCGLGEVRAHHNNLGSVSAVFEEDEGNVEIEPRFVDLYHLPADSPLIDGGTDRVISGLTETEYDREPRICGALPDIGADEYCDEAGKTVSTDHKQIIDFSRIGNRNRVEPENPGIDVTILNTPPDFAVGDNIQMVFQHDDGGLENLVVCLVDARGSRIACDVPDSDTAEPDVFLYYSWAIPPAVPPGKYTIHVQQPRLMCRVPSGAKTPIPRLRFENCDGSSRIFAIAPMHVNDVETSSSVAIVQPGYGETYFTDGFVHVHWQYLPEDHETFNAYVFARVLLKNGVEMDRFEPINYGGRSLWDRIPLFGYLSGSDYQVRVEQYAFDSTVDDEPVFVSSATSDYFNVQNYLDIIGECSERHPLSLYSPRAGVYRRGDELPIGWGFYRPSRDIPLRVLLVRDSTYGGSEWTIRESILPSCEDRGDCGAYPEGIDLLWIIPDDIPAGDGYRVYAEQIGGEGVSASVEPFTIE